METTITKDDRIAMAEVDYIINHMNERYINKIPQNVLDFIAILKNRKVEVYVDPKKPLDKQGLKEFTLYFLMILNLKYWCDDQRKKDILAMMENNQKKIDEKVVDIFNQAEHTQTISEPEERDNRPSETIIVNNISKTEENAQENAIVETTKENFFSKFIHKLKSIFKRNN